ncbi:MAG TPA: hypothetical protein VG387_14595 [Rhizomicrobium sp.]|jgi:uncharacterized protein YjlB|nr:hypothetical protein [Rhizomicrobium sp.]
MLESVKSVAEKLTGIRRPGRAGLAALTVARKANTYILKDDGETPNNPKMPLVVYRTPVRLSPDYDPAAIFEALFARNGWGGGWRDSMYDWLHWHTGTHEVLGIARGWLRCRMGGAKGRVLRVRAGDVMVLPAGTGHRRVAKSKDLLVVGAYPPGGGYDEKTPGDDAHDESVRAVARVPPPPTDPVYGKDGPLPRLWR